MKVLLNFRKIFIRAAVLLIAVGIFIKIWFFLTANFRIDKIEPNSFFNNYWDFVQKNDVDLTSILNQKYKFLNKGRQSFAFASDDQKYVIKFFRFHQFDTPVFYKILQFAFAKKKEGEKKISYLETMNSCKLVFEKLKEETAVVYLHLNKTKNLNYRLKIIDKLKRSYLVDLDNSGFVIQKKAKSFKKEILNSRNNRAYEGLINSFFNNLSSIYNKNIKNDDRHLMQNLGVVDNKIVEMDIGRFKEIKDFQKEEAFKKEVFHYTKYLSRWIDKNIPEAKEFFNDQLEEFIKSKK